MTPRSGSTWFASLLESTGILGRPHEFFALELPFVKQNPARSLADYVDHTRWMSTTANGIYAAKGNVYQVSPLIRRGLFVPSDVPTFFFYLTRSDLLRQGISLYLAIESGAWTSSSLSSRQPVFDSQRIWWWVDWLIRMMAEWERVFVTLGLDPVRLTYEELVEDPVAHVRNVADRLGVSIPASWSPIHVAHQKQATRLSDEWVRRLRDSAD